MRTLFVSVAFIGLCAACGGAAADDPTATAGPSPTPENTATPDPTATATTRPACETEDGELVSAVVNDYLIEWDDITALASSTPRIQLSVHVAELQRVRREFEDEEWPECAAETQRLGVRYMDKVIDAFRAFLSGSESQANTYIETSEEYLDDFVAELALMTVGAD